MNNKIAAAVLLPAAILCILLPGSVLFTGEGFLVHSVNAPETLRMLVEIFILYLLAGGIFFLIRDRRKQAAMALFLFTAFCWLHVVFLPMAASALYLGFLILAGRFLREEIFRIEDRNGYPADFLLGSSAVILCFCLLSAAGFGKIAVMRFVCLVAGIALYAAYGAQLYRRGKGSRLLGFCGEKAGGQTACDKKKIGKFFYPACLAFVFAAVAIQAGRMNIALDFDTLWYGVRSEYILAGGNGIYDNPGLVGMVYVYSKGLEVLTLPLCDLASHSYLMFFTLWLTVMGLTVVYRAACLFMKREYGLLAAVLCASLPGIMNMGISAKPDVITWLLQLIMIEYFFRYVLSNEKGGDASFLILAAGAYLLSLTMKPTSLVFSTAIFGMMGLYLIFSGRLSVRAPLRHSMALLLPAAALAGIWTRTMMITGMPVTSVFTSILAKLGFEMKYPFATGSLPQNWQDESNMQVLFRRLRQMLLAPEGKDMSHVIIAWGTSLLFFLSVCMIVFILSGAVKRENGSIHRASAVIFWPFLAVNMISLVMLYQVDGNYFMLLYTFLIFGFCRTAARLTDNGMKRLTMILLIPLLCFNVFVTAQTNWAWATGFSEIEVVNKGRYNHRAKQQEDMEAKGNTVIWQTLAAAPENRVIAFGEHPRCLAFPCNVQSYKDITSPWGNVEIVNSPEAFEKYMEYAGTDYIYAEAGYIGPGSWEWSYGLLRELIGRGLLTDLYFENGNALIRVGAERLAEEKAAENLRLFDENYVTSDDIEQEEEENG